jgi:murein DD-endopeptidase MepM/ murein hydrolase activator NlpD
MTRRTGFLFLGASLVVALCCAALIILKLGGLRKSTPTPAVAPTSVEPAPPAAPISTIIDLPGDPVLVRRGTRTVPRTLHVTLPIALTPNAAKFDGTAYFVTTSLVSTDGGFMGKFLDAAGAAPIDAAQLNGPNADEVAAAQEWGADDDGGASTPANANTLIIDSGNSSVLEATIGGVNGRPQIKETVINTVIQEKLSDLLIRSGYSEDSSRAAESAAKATFNIQSLPANSIAIVEGAVDLSGDYRVTQLSIYENNEYVGAIALAEAGGYGEGAQPLPPDGVFNAGQAAPVAAVQYDLADGLYSAGVRNNIPEPIIREAIQLLGRLTNLKAPLAADESARFLYAPDRSKSQSSGKVIYIGLSGSAGPVDCYSFAGAVGSFQCFDPKGGEIEASPPPPPASGGGPPRPSGAGLIPPIKGAPITSRFGMRFHPILHILRLHAGIDFGAAVGSAVRAVADGKVEIAGPVSGFGNHVRILHDGFETSYSHLSEIPANIKPGALVTLGEVIALSGNTGLSTGPHLHFEYYLNGVAVDPLPHMGAEVAISASAIGAPTPPQRPNDQEIAAFNAAKAIVDAALDAASH